MMFTKAWWNKAFERMAKTGAQVVIILIPGDKITEKVDLPWEFIASSVAAGMLLSLAFSITTTKIGPDKNDPSAV